MHPLHCQVQLCCFVQEGRHFIGHHPFDLLLGFLQRDFGDSYIPQVSLSRSAPVAVEVSHHFVDFIKGQMMGWRCLPDRTRLTPKQVLGIVQCLIHVLGKR